MIVQKTIQQSENLENRSIFIALQLELFIMLVQIKFGLVIKLYCSWLTKGQFQKRGIWNLPVHQQGH